MNRGDPVTVVGAGPAGLACAIVLARAGQRVVVREWRNRPGTRFHGDFQGLENWSHEQDTLSELRAYGIETNFEAHPVYKGVAFDPWGQSHVIQSKRPLYYLVRRGDPVSSLEAGLLNQAKEAGAEISFGTRIERLNGPAVLATGPRTADVIASGYTFQTDMPDGNWIAFNDLLAPLGYAYLLVRNGAGTVASCMFTGFKQHAEHLARTVQFFGDRAGLRMQYPKAFGGFGNFRLPRKAVQGQHLVVGEQAGFQDALAGFGMRYALRSGALAARSLIEGVDYTKLWRRELLPLLKAGISNRFLFNFLGPRGRRWALHKISAPGSAATLRKLYSPSVPTRLIFPIAHLMYRVPLADPSCDHAGCDCVWCRNGVG